MKKKALSRQPSAVRKDRVRPAFVIPRSRLRKGDLAEVAFLNAAMYMGFNVFKPFGTACRYDFIVDAYGRLSRVQVKSCWEALDGHRHYLVRLAATGSYTNPYVLGDFDFVAAYVAREDAWYIIPLRRALDPASVCLFPHNPNSRGRYERYREAWHLLLPRGVKIGDIQACADESYQPSAISREHETSD